MLTPHIYVFIQMGKKGKNDIGKFVYILNFTTKNALLHFLKEDVGVFYQRSNTTRLQHAHWTKASKLFQISYCAILEGSHWTWHGIILKMTEGANYKLNNVTINNSEKESEINVGDYEQIQTSAINK